MAKRLFKIGLFLATPLLLFFILILIYIHTPTKAKDRRLSIEKGMSVEKIGEALAKQEIILHPRFFQVYVQITRRGGQLKAGDYLFKKVNTPKEVLERIVSGRVLLAQVRLLEGWTIEQILDYLEKTHIKTGREFRKEFLRLTQDRKFIASLGLFLSSLEGYLFPETYHFPIQTTPKKLIRTFVEEFKKNYAKVIEETPKYSRFTQQEIVTLASIIEKETSLDEERGVIASVFLNRLRKGMLLQSDPTIIYGLKDFDGNIRTKDIRNPHPYNTYVHAGLPPGPICNPGYASIKAVLNPAKTDYLYFVSKNNGSHHFSKTRKEHWEAVREFQLRKKTTSSQKEEGDY